MSKLSKSHMPGWVSNGPVQINVGRDLHIHGGGKLEAAAQALTTLDRGPTGMVALKVIGLLLAAAVAIPLIGVLLCAALLAGGLFLGTFLAIMTLVLLFWVGGRCCELYLWTERKIAGGRGRLLYVPAFLKPNDDAQHALESDYDHNIIDTTSNTAALVPARPNLRARGNP